MQKSRNATEPIALLFVLTLGYAVFAADRTVLSAVLSPMAKSLGATPSETFFLQAAQFIGVFCFVFLAGQLSDKYGKWKVIVAGVFVFTVFTWMIGFSTSYSEAFAFRLVSGFGEGLFWPVAMAWVGSRFGLRKGLALGIFYIGFDLGSIGGVFIGGASFALFNAWQPAFFIAPSIGVVVLAALPFIRKGSNSRSELGDARMTFGKDSIRLLQDKFVLLLVVFAFLATWASLWQTAFLPLYFNKVAGFSVPYAAFMTIPVLASGALGKAIMGATSDRWLRNRVLLLMSLATMACYVIFFFAQNFDFDILAALGMGFFASAIFPVFQALVIDTCGQARAGTALGLTTSAQAIGAIFSATFTASLVSLGIGKTLALNAMLPSALLVLVTVFLVYSRVGRLR